MRNNNGKLILYLLLLVPVVSSILSTIHIISLTSLGNPFVMAIATAVTYEISSIVSFISSGNSNFGFSKARLYFIFIVLFILQCVGNTYSGFHYINMQLVADPAYLNDIMEMSFNILRPAELKLSLAALIGIPLPLISLIMLKTALEFAEGRKFEEPKVDIVEEPKQSEDETKYKNKPNFREKYENITNSDWFKKAYEDKSVGDIIKIEDEPVNVEEKPEQAEKPVQKVDVKNEKPVEKVKINKQKPRPSIEDRDPSDKNII